MVETLRKFYRHTIHSPSMDRCIYAVLDTLTDTYSKIRGYYFPANYIRRWKLNMLWELYEPETVTLCKTILKPGMVVVDIGAHIGYFTNIFSTLVGQHGFVYAFEADPENAALLKKNTNSRANVKNISMAVSDRSGSIRFYHVEKSGCHSILPNIPQDFGKKTTIIVESTSLDTFCEQEQIKRVDVIKMDIEGAESVALRGMEQTMRRNSTLILIIEFAPRWIEAAGFTAIDLLAYVASFGFDIYAITPDSTPPQLTKLDPSDPTCYQSFFTRGNNFVNLYCRK